MVDELTHEQIRERIRIVFKPQLFQVEEIAAALLSVQDGDDLTLDPVLAQPALLQRVVGHVQIEPLRRRLAFVEPLAGPECVRLMRHARWR